MPPEVGPSDPGHRDLRPCGCPRPVRRLIGMDTATDPPARRPRRGRVLPPRRHRTGGPAGVDRAGRAVGRAGQLHSRGRRDPRPHGGVLRARTGVRRQPGGLRGGCRTTPTAGSAGAWSMTGRATLGFVQSRRSRAGGVAGRVQGRASHRRGRQGDRPPAPRSAERTPSRHGWWCLVAKIAAWVRLVRPSLASSELT